MAKRTTTPAELAARLHTDVDDVLLMLWDADLNYPRGPHSIIRAQDVAVAERCCGLAAARERLLVAFWERHFDFDRAQFQDYASTLGIHIGPDARRLPKGALAKLDRATTTKSPALSSRDGAVAKAQTPFVWQERGNRRDALTYLSADDIFEIHMSIADDFADSPDPISPAGVRDQALLESAAARPEAGLGDIRKYPTVQMAAAALMHSVVHNHAFFNGNKRTGLVSMLSFLDANGFVLTTNEEELFRWTIRVAKHGLNHENYAGDLADIEVQAMTGWLVEHSRLIDHTNRIITAGQLQKRLTLMGCEVQQSGTKIRITRSVSTSYARWRKVKTRTLGYSIPYGGEGRQVSRANLRELRRNLQLTEEHGYDSAAFFGTDKTPTDDFISRYRKTLNRLAKV